MKNRLCLLICETRIWHKTDIVCILLECQSLYQFPSDIFPPHFSDLFLSISEVFLNVPKSYQIDMEKRLCVPLDKALYTRRFSVDWPELNVSQQVKVYSLRMNHCLLALTEALIYWAYKQIMADALLRRAHCASIISVTISWMTNYYIPNFGVKFQLQFIILPVKL